MKKGRLKMQRFQTNFIRQVIVRSLLLFSFFIFHFSFVQAQEVVDKMVAVINGRELITHTDLLWQLALEPNVPLDNPRSEDLNRVLQLLIDQRLIAQEAEKLPSISPRNQEIDSALAELVSRFPSKAGFYERLARVGLGEDSEQLREIVRQRVAIENYLIFRFRSFAIVTPQEVDDYYRNVWVPRRRRQAPGRIVPELKDARAEIEKELTESKVESDIDQFLEDARNRAEIQILSPV
jgi:hypothetical protein